MFVSLLVVLVVERSSLGVGAAPALSDRQLQCANLGYCHTEAKGILTSSLLRLPDIEIPPDTRGLSFFIPDKCDGVGRELVGSVVHACDADAMPTLAILNTGVGVARVHRNGDLTSPAFIYMQQYCS